MKGWVVQFKVDTEGRMVTYRQIKDDDIRFRVKVPWVERLEYTVYLKRIDKDSDERQ